VLVFLALYSVFNTIELKLYSKIFIGLILGILCGVFFNEQIVIYYPVGQAFIRLIKMIVIPLVFSSILIGTANLGDISKLGKIGIRTMAFYIVSTAIAITIGLIIANTIQPGKNISDATLNELKLNYDQEAKVKIDKVQQNKDVKEILLDIIPSNPARSIIDGKMLQIIFIAIISGIALIYVAEDKRIIIVKFFGGITDICIKLVHFIMILAPYGVFALISFVVAQYGSGIILTLLEYFITTLIALLIHVSIFNSVIIHYFTVIKISEFWKGIYPAILVAFSTSSSSATLPVSMECAEDNLKVKPRVASFVLPLGSTINMDGTAIFQGVSAIFIASIYGIDLSIADQLTILLTATLASIGTAGAPQVGIIMLTLVLETIGIPLEGIALILGVERFLDMARTTVNISSDLSCAGYIDHVEKRDNKDDI